MASESPTSPGFSSRYCDEAVSLPSPAADLRRYKDALVTLAGRPDVRTIVPVREEDAYVLSRYRSEFVDDVGVLWPSMDQLSRVHDRLELYRIAEEAGVSFPQTRLLSDVADWDREMIVKARFALLADEYVQQPETGPVSMGKTRYLEPGVRLDVEEVRREMGHTPIAQEYIDGAEYCFRGLYDHGDPIVTTQKRLVRGMKYPRGPSVCHEAVDLPALEEAGRALLDRLDWHGLASVGFIRDSSGDFNLLEVNPRMWASLPMDVRAGVDYPFHYWKLSRGEPIDADPAYRPGARTHFLRGELLHLHSVLTEEYPLVEAPSLAETVTGTLSSLLSEPHFDYFDVDDPGPFVRDVLNLVSSVEQGG